jgi:hypothetical protein
LKTIEPVNDSVLTSQTSSGKRLTRFQIRGEKRKKLKEKKEKKIGF